MVWYGVEWYGMVWTVWSGMVWYGMAQMGLWVSGSGAAAGGANRGAAAEGPTRRWWAMWPLQRVRWGGQGMLWFGLLRLLGIIWYGVCCGAFSLV